MNYDETRPETGEKNMSRAIAVSVVFLIAITICGVRTTEAGPISNSNPYRSFNLTGVNYASMQWERKYGNKSHKSSNARRSRGRFFRRW
jgi:hypothetical protein